MSQVPNWFERKFEFLFQVGIFPNADKIQKFQDRGHKPKARASQMPRAA
jgi:hypothetical protein